MGLKPVGPAGSETLLSTLSSGEEGGPGGLGRGIRGVPNQSRCHWYPYSEGAQLFGGIKPF